MIKDITIGSDPEYVFETRTGKFMESYEILRPVQMAMCGKVRRICEYCNSNSLFCGHGGNSAQIGYDGALGELRPNPGKTPIEHVENIQKLIDAIDFLPDHIVMKGGTVHQTHSIGGHIHIGMPQINGQYLEITDNHNFAMYMSHYCGIPLRKIEIYKDLMYRGLGRMGFGKFGGYDVKSYGIEWRMPASWLVSKEIATAALCLAYVVAQNYDPPYYTMKTVQYRGYLKTKIPYIIKAIEEMEGYEIYAKEIEPLFRMIINKEVWDPNLNIKDTWK